MIPEGNHVVTIKGCEIEPRHDKAPRVSIQLRGDDGLEWNDRIALHTTSGPNILREKMNVIGFPVPSGKEPEKHLRDNVGNIVGRTVSISVRHKVNQRGFTNVYCYYNSLVTDDPVATVAHAKSADPYPELSEETKRMLRQTGRVSVR